LYVRRTLLLSNVSSLCFTHILCYFFFACKATSPPLLYPLSLHDALPISAESFELVLSESVSLLPDESPEEEEDSMMIEEVPSAEDRKSTRLNSSHVSISYAVFCLKKKTGSVNDLHKRRGCCTPGTGTQTS